MGLPDHLGLVVPAPETERVGPPRLRAPRRAASSAVMTPPWSVSVCFEPLESVVVVAGLGGAEVALGVGMRADEEGHALGHVRLRSDRRRPRGGHGPSQRAARPARACRRSPPGRRRSGPRRAAGRRAPAPRRRRAPSASSAHCSAWASSVTRSVPYCRAADFVIASISRSAIVLTCRARPPASGRTCRGSGGERGSSRTATGRGSRAASPSSVARRPPRASSRSAGPATSRFFWSSSCDCWSMSFITCSLQ